MARPKRKAASTALSSSLEFFSLLKWLDGRPLMDTIEDYRRRGFTELLDTRREDGSPQFNFALWGRAKKNNKTTDLVLCAFYKLLVPHSVQGNQCYIVANDEQQAADDLALAKKLVQCNPVLQAELKIERKRIVRKDGRGFLEILPARDSAGAHGKTWIFFGIDEMHAYKDYDLLEAMQFDPTQLAALMMIVSYDSFYCSPGYPLFDFKALGRSGDDPRMHFQWYSADLCSDLAFADLPPEERANPSMESWADKNYLAQQKRRLPFHRYRRLHLNLPGSPEGSIFSPDNILEAVVKGRKALHPDELVERLGGARPRLAAFVDMSGGSSDDACLGVSFWDARQKKAVLVSLVSQLGRPPFNPRQAVRRFCDELSRWGLSQVTGDAYAGETFRRDFQDAGITYKVSDKNASELYEAFEVQLNAGEIELLDIQKMQDQFLGLVLKGSKITHLAGEHDDWANAAAGALTMCKVRRTMHFTPEMMREAGRRPDYARGDFGLAGRGGSWPPISNLSTFPTTIIK
jgi:hypothetical protein